MFFENRQIKKDVLSFVDVLSFDSSNNGHKEEEISADKYLIASAVGIEILFFVENLSYRSSFFQNVHHEGDCILHPLQRFT